MAKDKPGKKPRGSSDSTEQDDATRIPEAGSGDEEAATRVLGDSGESTEIPEEVPPARLMGGDNAPDDEATQHTVPGKDSTRASTADQSDEDATELVDRDATERVDDSPAPTMAIPTDATSPRSPSKVIAAMQSGDLLKDRFELDEKLGEGGMGAVFRATDRRKVETRHHDPHVAIKLLAGDFAQDSRAFIALQRETDKSQTLAHPNIITVYDFDRDGDVFFMTMESLRGNTLDHHIRAQDLDRHQTLSYIADIANGIAYAHKRNIVHSDLKPQNIFITEEGTLKILDFGIARAFSGMDSSGAPSRDPSEIVGLTPPYASYEMFQGQDPHPADDVYAIGLIAYEMLTGHHPFDRRKATEAREQGLKPRRIRGLKGHQWQAIARALAFDRANRWQDAEQFRRRFTGVGRVVKQLSAALLIAVVSFGGYLVFYEPPAEPDIPFEQLPPATQQQFRESLEEGRQALRFDDLNGALFYFDRAYNLHPRNREAVQELDRVVERIIAELGEPETPREVEQQHTTITELMRYDSLSHNSQLASRQQALEEKMD